jgi:hypothetical protein
MWRRVDLVLTDVSEERIAYIFRVEKSVSEEPAWADGSSYFIVTSRSYRSDRVENTIPVLLFPAIT